MMTSATSPRSDASAMAHQPQAANGLAIVRVTIGAMFVWVFFENLGKGLYTPAGYAGLINYYIKNSHSPAIWKAVMALAASHAAMAAPMQAVTEISLGILLVIGLLTRPAAFVAFLYLGSLWISEWGTAWIWELLVPVLASLGLAIGSAGRRWGVDAWLAQRWPSSLLVVIGPAVINMTIVRCPSSSPRIMKRRRLSAFLADLPSDLITEVIVVDSNSNDGTPEIAARMGARVVQEPRRGYGRACLTGLAMANSPDVVVFLDGDYSDRPSELPILLAPIIEGRADIALGSRLHSRSSAGALPWHQAFGNRLAASLIRLLYSVNITDLGPFRAARAEVLSALALKETTYGWAVEMILKGALSGFRVVEVPVSYYPRIGKSKISGTLKGTLGAGWFILSLIVRYYFRPAKNWDTSASVGPLKNCFYGIFERDRGEFVR